jgi:hypothetical protein
MLQHAGFYNTDIAAGLLVLHDLPMFMRQALCNELGCNVHSAMLQLGWRSTLHDGAAHPALQHVELRCHTSCRFLCRWAVLWRSHRLAGLALLLALPAHVAAQTAITDANFITAASAWNANSNTAAADYGPIADWNTAAVTNMNSVCAASARGAPHGDALGRYSEIYTSLGIFVFL